METDYVEVSFAMEVAKHLKGKYVEIYTGGSSRTLKYAEWDDNKKEVLRGILIDCSGDLLILEVTNPITNNKNNVYINGWSVKAMLEPKNGMSIIDVFVIEYEKQPK